MGVCDLPGVSGLCDAAGGAVAEAAAGTLTVMAQAFAQGANGLLSAMMTFWIDLPSPSIEAAGSPMLWLQSNLAWITGAVGVLSMLWIAGQIVVKGEGGAALLGQHLWRIAMYGSLTTVVISLGISAGDSFSRWIINQAPQPEGYGNLTTEVMLTSFGPAVLLFAAMFSIFSSLIQTALMTVRQALLIALCASLPTTVQAAGTETGLAALRRQTAWCLALLLYKPTAACLYALSFTMMNTSWVSLDGAAAAAYTQLLGVILAGMTIVALPALMRLVAPVTIAAGGGGGGGGIAVAGALGGVIATGAAMRSRGGVPAQGGPAPAGATQAASGAATGAGGAAAAAGTATGASAGSAAASATAGAGAAAGPAGAALGPALMAAQSAAGAAQGAATRTTEEGSR